MAKNLYNLTEVSTVNNSDLLHVNQGSVSSDKKVTKQNLLKEVNSSITSINNSLTNSLKVGDPMVKTDISLSSAGIQLFDWAELNPPPSLSGYTFVDYIFVSSTYRFCLLGRGGTRVYYYVGTTYANSGSVTAYPIYRKNA